MKNSNPVRTLYSTTIDGALQFHARTPELGASNGIYSELNFCFRCEQFVTRLQVATASFRAAVSAQFHQWSFPKAKEAYARRPRYPPRELPRVDDEDCPVCIALAALVEESEGEYEPFYGLHNAVPREVGKIDDRGFGYEQVPLQVWELEEPTIEGNGAIRLYLEDKRSGFVDAFQPKVIPEWFDFDLGRSWVNDFKNLRADADEMQFSAVTLDVFRLVNIETMCREVYQSANLKEYNYIALSHAIDDEKLSCYEDALSERGTLKPTALPQTILDTIVVAQKFGVKYIWIDILCLDRDSITYAKELANIGFIFHGASLTVIDASKDGSGLSGVSTPRQYFPEPVDVPFSMAGQDYNLKMLINEWEPRDCITEDSKWATKPQSVIEQAVSPRKLIFTDKEAFFITGDRHFAESINAEFLPADDCGEWRYQLDAFPEALFSYEDPYYRAARKSIDNIFAEYQAKTQDEDRTYVAVKPLFDYFCHVFGATHLWGLLTEQIMGPLLWSSEGPGRRIQNQMGQRLPSWSPHAWEFKERNLNCSDELERETFRFHDMKYYALIRHQTDRSNRKAILRLLIDHEDNTWQTTTTHDNDLDPNTVFPRIDTRALLDRSLLAFKPQTVKVEHSTQPRSKNNLGNYSLCVDLDKLCKQAGLQDRQGEFIYAALDEYVDPTTEDDEEESRSLIAGLVLVKRKNEFWERVARVDVDVAEFERMIRKEWWILLG